VSQRFGHASVGFTLSVYSHALPGIDRDPAETMARLVLGKDLEVTVNTAKAGVDPGEPGPSANPCASGMETALQVISEGPFRLVAGTGFEPATSGL
jgi:hypothetical protein